MDIELNSQKIYELLSLDGSFPLSSSVLPLGRTLVGRTQSCGIIIDHPSISAIHAVIEVTPQKIMVYDMNSKNGVFINGKKIIAAEIKLADKIHFSNLGFSLQEQSKAPALPPILETLDPVKGQAHTELSKNIDGIVFPLALDPKADTSEYIFEDANVIYPIFNYDVSKQAVEVTIIHDEQVFEISYIPEKDGIYRLVGWGATSKDIEFPYLGVKEKVPFIEIRKGNIVGNKIHDYKAYKLTKTGLEEIKSSSFNIDNKDIIKLTNGKLDILLRKVSSPPVVKTPPFFRRDKELKKYLLLALLFFIPVVLILQTFKIDPEDKKEEVAAKRIATIMYKQKLTLSKNDAVEKTEKKENIAQKAPPKEEKPKEKVEQKEAVSEALPKPKEQPKKEAPGKKVAKSEPVKKAQNPTKDTPKSAMKEGGAPKAATSAQKAPTELKSAGAVDVYKSIDFKSTVSSLVAKGGSLSGATTAAQDSSASLNSATVGGGSISDNLKKASVSSDIGSLEGAATGKIGDIKGAEGIAIKKGIYTAGIPAETVVLGSMDPDVIRRILREHIPQFRSCYQNELEARQGSNLSGTVKLQFVIGASGSVSRANAESSTLPGNVKNCVVRVLRGIQFPSPLGGGEVEVSQPFNFMAQKI